MQQRFKQICNMQEVVLSNVNLKLLQLNYHIDLFETNQVVDISCLSLALFSLTICKATLGN